MSVDDALRAVQRFAASVFENRRQQLIFNGLSPHAFDNRADPTPNQRPTMAQMKNDTEAIDVLESVLAYLRKQEFKESGRPAPDFSDLGAVKVRDADAD